MSWTDVYVLNVGAGSCTVIESPSGHVSMVDLNDGSDQRSYETAPSEQPLTDPVAWCTEVLGASSLFRFVLSHPDGDHMAGLRRLLIGSTLDIVNFWDLPHHRVRNEGDFKNEEARLDWLAYVAMREAVPIEGVSWPKVIRPLRGDSRDFWNEDGIKILSPTTALVAAADESESYNDASYVLRVRWAERSVLLAGDVEEPGWQDMIAADKLAHMRVLVASHHGRKSGFSEEAMDIIRPKIVIVSTARLPAAHDAINEYEAIADHVLSTRVDGDLRVRLHDFGYVEVTNAAGELVATA